MLDHAALSTKVQELQYAQTIASGNHYGLILLESASPIDLEVGRSVVSKIEEEIAKNDTILPSDLIARTNESLSADLTLNAVFTLIQSDSLAVTKFGDVGAKLLRDSKVINLLDPTNAEEKSLHGPLKRGDQLVLGTKGFFALATLTTIAAQPDSSAVEKRDSVLSLVETSSPTVPLAALFVSYFPEPPSPVTENSEVDDVILPEERRLETPVEEEVFASEVAVNSDPLPITQARPQFAATPSGPSLLALALKLVQNPTRIIAQIKHYGRSFNDPEAPRSLRKPLYLSLIVLVTLFSLVAFQLRSRASESSVQLIAQLTAEVETSLNEAKKMSGLNDQVARDALLEERMNLEQKTQGLGPTELQAVAVLIAKLDDQIQQVSHIYPVLDIATFYDFALLKNGPGISGAQLHEGQILALDSKNGAVYSLGSGTKTAAIVGGSDDLKSTSFIDFSETRAVVMGSSGIFAKTLGDSSQFRRVISSSSDWGAMASFATFANNLYLLDSEKNEIWKYQGSGSGFSDMSSYLAKGLSLDLSKTNSLAIDGAVYVLSSSGTIVKFNGGVPEDFSLLGLPDELKSPSKLFTNETSENLYFMDDNDNRVWVVTKKGSYVARYELPKNKGFSVVALLADEAQKKVFLVSSDKVYSFNLR